MRLVLFHAIHENGKKLEMKKIAFCIFDVQLIIRMLGNAILNKRYFQRFDDLLEVENGGLIDTLG